MNDTKNPLRSLGIMGPLVSLIVWGLNKFMPGLGLDEATVGIAIDQGAILVGTLTAIWGRFRATTEIKL
jgi:hypothetical protein